MILYKTIKNLGSAEQEIEKSRFLVHAMPADTKEKADQFIKKIKHDYKDATHNVPAMVIGDKMQIQWGSDDGEPQGTSGAPIVQMMVKEGITNTVVVVTRYFGGIKLGTGGLVRAYTSSAKLGIEAGKICDVKEIYSLVAKIDYSYLAKFESLQKDGEFQIGEKVYEEKVTIEFIFDKEYRDKVKNILKEVTSGNVEILRETEKIDLVELD